MDRIYKIENTYYSEYMGPESGTVYIEARDEDEARQLFGDRFPLDNDGYCGNYEIDELDLTDFDRSTVPAKEGHGFYTRETGYDYF